MDRNQADVGVNRMSAAGARASRRGACSVWCAGVLAISVLIVAGAAYRVAVAEYFRGIGEPVKLPIPLSEIPTQIGGWVGTTLEISAATEEYMRANFADDYVRRRYVHAEASLGANVYLVYCSSRPAGIIGHQPLVCLPGHGLIHDKTVPSEVVSSSGRLIQCQIHRFHDPQTYQPIVVLSFYVVNGQTTLSEKDFSGVWGRRPNLSGDYARYVAQVQIDASFGLAESSERSVRIAASEIVDTLLAHLPDKDGRVVAADPNANR